MAKRILLFVVTNFLIFVTISIILNVLGLQGTMYRQGLDYTSLMIVCLIWGMGASIISLMMSRVIAKFTFGIQVINPAAPGEFSWLLNMVDQLAKTAGLPRAPEVGIYDSPEVNAFATGPTKRRSIVAFSRGILQRMDQQQLEGVAGHEIAHIANGDMVTMTLLQGVVNAFVFFLANVIAFAISQNVREESRYTVRWITRLILEIVIGLLGSIVVYWFSRQREYRADAGSVRFAGKSPMLSALHGLQNAMGLIDPSHQAAATLKISSGKARASLFASHPSLEDRIARLEAL